MKTATQNLEDDHVYILKLTEIMVAITKSERPEISEIDKVIDIIKNFADGIHHAKEENLLFPKLVEKGFSVSQGPVAVMLQEHAAGRQYVKEMIANIALLNDGNLKAINEVFKNMNGYANLLGDHISKENNILFRMADKVLSVTEQETLLSQFEELEKNTKPGSSPADYITMIVELGAIYNI